MNLRTKTVAGIALTFLGLILVLYQILTQSYAKIELQNTRINIDRTLNALQYEFSNLQNNCGDWAYWDDTYHFVDNQSPKYVDSNVSAPALGEIDIDLVIILNTADKILYIKYIDAETEEELPISDSLLQNFQEKSPLFDLPELHSEGAGLILLPEKPMLVVSKNILTSDEEGPAKGTLIMGRFLDEALIEDFANLTQLGLEFVRYNDSDMPEDFAQAKNALSENETNYVNPLSLVEIAGYSLIRDVFGEPALILRVAKPRDIFIEGLSTIRGLIGVFLLFGLIFCGVAVLFMERILLSRLSQLSAEVREAEEKGDFGKRLTVKGRDELTNLVTAFNHFLDTIQRSQKALVESQDLLESTQKVAGIGSWKWDMVTNELIGSKEMRRILQIGESNGTIEIFYSRVHPEDLPLVRQAIRFSLSQDQPQEMEHRILLNKGVIQWVRNHWKVQTDEKTGHLSLIGTLQDIAEAKQAEKERFELEEQLRRAQRMEAFGQMTAGIAHNFNNLLTNILGNLYLAQRQAKSEILKYLQSAESGGKQAVDLVKNMLLFSRNVEPKSEPFNLNSVVHAVVNIISNTFDKNIEIQVQTEMNLPAVMGDSGQIQQALLNLCINARDALEECLSGQPQIRIRTALHAHNGQSQVELSVADNGMGMDEETQKHIFDPFFTTKEVGKGTGLGLASVYGIVKQHRGRIQVESVLHKGSLFQIVLPTTDQSPALEWRTTAEPEQGTETILLIEDDETVRNLMREVLDQFGYTILAGRDGEEGWEFYKMYYRMIDLVILDLSLPKVTGEVVLKRILDLNPEAKVLICSGYTGEAFDLKGAVDVVNKPIEIAEFLHILRRALSQKTN